MTTTATPASPRRKRGLIVWLALALVAMVLLAAAVPLARWGRAQLRRVLGPPGLSVALVASGLSQPTDIAHTGVAGDERLFVVEREGRIRIVDPDGSVRATPFLDLGDRVEFRNYGEQGLLGLVFDPDYAATGEFYVYYSDLQDNIQLSRFRVSADPDAAAAEETPLLNIAVDAPLHYGGDLAFGPDGYLYVAVGVGAAEDGPHMVAQETDSLRGKLLRLDVRGVSTYTIPVDNPLVAVAGARPEIWALGLRNPWRISFDRVTGDLYIVDVGQSTAEEVNFQPAGSAGGQNYGWPCWEGRTAQTSANCPPAETVTGPVISLDRQNASALVGGYVYRGERYARLQGYYIFGDFATSGLWVARPGEWEPISYWGLGLNLPSTFGEDAAGELFAASYTDGAIFRIGPD